jgi:hypothetical protein
MADLSRIVSVSVSTSTAAVKQSNFGIPMVLGYHTVHGDLVRTYANMTELAADHPLATNPGIYKACAAIFAQSPQVDTVKVGRLTAAPTMIYHITPVAQNSTVYSLSITGTGGVTTTASFTSDANATVAEITAGLAAAVSATGVTASDQTTHLRLTGTAGGWICAEPNSASLMDCRQVHVATLTSGQLDNILAVDSDWYCFVNVANSGQSDADYAADFSEENTASDVGVAAAWASTNKKLFFAQIQGNGIKSATADISSDITSNDYAVLMYHLKASEMAHAAWVGATMAMDPGSLTFMFKQLEGITVDTLSSTELGNLETKKSNWYTSFGGIGITGKGTAQSGDFIDVTRDTDWFQARLQERIANMLINNAKVPFTDKGIAMVEAELRAQLQEGIDAGFLAESPAPVITVPRASAVSGANKALRNLPSVQADATLAGAIHKVTLSVNVTL